jgi:hypothetical protein
MTLDEQIDIEVYLYVHCCEQASKHDGYEPYYRSLAHMIFYHILEMRSTRSASPLGELIPISK